MPKVVRQTSTHPNGATAIWCTVIDGGNDTTMPGTLGLQLRMKGRHDISKLRESDRKFTATESTCATLGQLLMISELTVTEGGTVALQPACESVVATPTVTYCAIVSRANAPHAKE